MPVQPLDCAHQVAVHAGDVRDQPHTFPGHKAEPVFQEDFKAWFGVQCTLWLDRAPGQKYPV